MTKPLTTLLLALGLALSPLSQAGDKGTYRWYDEEGTVQYADRPPEGVDAEYIEFSVSSSSRDKEEQTADSDASQDGKKEPKVYDEMEVLPEKDPAKCQQAKDNLEALKKARIRITEPDGSKRMLTEEEKETQREHAKKFIDMHC